MSRVSNSHSSATGDSADRLGAMMRSVEAVAAAPSVVTEIASHATDLATMPSGDVPGWLHGLTVPDGWQIARTDRPTGLFRITVAGQRIDGGWDATDTLAVFRFTGLPPAEVVRTNADSTLRALNADGITTHPLQCPKDAHTAAARSSGYINAAGRRIWAQYSTYLAGSDGTAKGLLVLHAVFASSNQRALLRDDVADVSDAVHHGFLNHLDTMNTTTFRPAMEVRLDGA